MNKINVNKALVAECLKEMSDISFQKRVWILGDANQITGFNDVVAGLFDDSALSQALDKNDVTYTKTVDYMLRTLDRKLAALPADLKTLDLIETPEWQEIAKLAGDIYRLID